MLYIVLILVLAALALLVTALITAGSLWAFVSIGLSVVAGLLLLADWLRRRTRTEPAAPPEGGKDEPGTDDRADTDRPETAVADGTAGSEQTVLLPATGELGDPADVPEPDLEPEPDPEPEPEPDPAPAAAGKPVRDTPPAEEETSADDLAIITELEDEVVVVDEYPRYHLVDCPWLSGRDTIPIGVGEARQLGFTPCIRCGPDAVLATAHRKD